MKHRFCRRLLATLMLAILLALGACQDPFEHAHCDDTVVAEKKSPDGKYIATVYHRSCSGGSGRYTCAKIEETPAHFWSMKGETGYVMTIPEFHPIAVAWKDARQLEIITPGLQRQVPSTLEKSWADINISYKLTTDH